jgi:hypothetical protein
VVLGHLFPQFVSNTLDKLKGNFMGWLTDFAGSPAQELAAQGRNGDTMLAHINPQEAQLLKSLGGSGTINPKTGLPEFWGVKLGPVGIGSDYGGVSVGNTSLADVYDTTTNALQKVDNTLTGGIGNSIVSGARGLTGGLAGGIEDMTGLNLSDPATMAAIAAAAYGYYDPEAFAAAGGAEAAGNAAATDAAATTAAADTSSALTAGSAGQASNIALSSELPAGYSAGAVDSTLANAGAGTQVAGPASLAETTAGSTGTGLNASGYLGTQGLESTVPGYTGSIGYGAGGEGLTATTAPGAAVNPAWSEAIAPAENAPWSLSDLGSTLKSGATSLGNTIMDNKLATAMIGSSLYDAYAKKQMAKQMEDRYNQQQAAVNNYYAPGSPEYNLAVDQAKRAAVQAGRPIDSSQFTSDIAAKIADAKLRAQTGMSTGQNQLMASQLGNQYGGLNTLFNNMALYTQLAKKGLV